ncbi:hypothetical protein [uncultured Nostoc sp.]|uniref:hypothetical protein n=1 Tax=uncultured Nostoc sp. TaxID=340711 RepID=UPI002625B7ED|nr:hypothetical protein [uncultured Nostoc sp.]
MPKANAPPLILGAVLKGDNTTPVRSSRETMHGSSSWGKPPSPLASPFGRRPDCRRSYVANAALTPDGWLP